MDIDDPTWVPKVHPLARDATTDDPFELLAEPVGGDPRVMLECLLQEFLWMGWTAEQLLALFRHPGYPVLCELREHFGDDAVREQVESLVARTGVLQFRETIAEEDPEPELVEIGMTM